METTEGHTVTGKGAGAETRNNEKDKDSHLKTWGQEPHPTNGASKCKGTGAGPSSAGTGSAQCRAPQTEPGASGP